MSNPAVGLSPPRSPAARLFSARSVVPELMDDPTLSAAAHNRALRGLARINWVSAAATSFTVPLQQLCTALAGRCVRVLDVASGGGDVPVRLARWAARRHLPLEFAGCDVHPGAVAAAQACARAHGVAVRFFAHDVVAGGVPGGYHAILSSLFLHHLSTPQAVLLLAAMRDTGARLVAVNDLLRSPLAYAVAWAGTRVLSASPVVRHDGPLSVRAAYTLAEARALAAAAGLTGAVVRWRWPFRFLLTWRRS